VLDPVGPRIVEDLQQGLSHPAHDPLLQAVVSEVLPAFEGSCAVALDIVDDEEIASDSDLCFLYSLWLN
jgi:hypothetical protein